MRKHFAEKGTCYQSQKKSEIKMSQSKMQMKGGDKVDYTVKNSNPAEGVSLCIPRVFNNIGYKRIKDVFIRMGWGFVERVDLIQLKGFKRAYVHFKAGEWNMRSREAMSALEALKAGDEVTITYDDPWFWKIGISRSARPAEAPKPKPRPKVQIGKLKPAVEGLSVETGAAGAAGGEGKEDGEV